MSFDIKLPNISATTDREKLEQIRSYLHQLAEQLRWALNSIESNAVNTLQNGSKANMQAVSKGEDQATFNSVKSLIIKSADIVNTYYDEINRRLAGVYVAQSDFGTYEERTEQAITENSKEIERAFTNIQKIFTDIEGLEHSLIEVNANIRTGLLYYDDNSVPIYGVEVGQKNEIDGVEVFNKYARFTSDRLSFYDQSGTEVAYISDNKLYIANIEVLVSIKKGNLIEVILANGDTVTKCIRKE